MMHTFKWISTIAGSSVAFIAYLEREKRKVAASWTTGFVPSKKWDNNWDRRDPSVLISPKKLKSLEGSGDKQINEEKQKFSTTATRNLFFIRHGQYNLKGNTDAEMYLTPLGKEQAQATGLRLKELNLNFTKVFQSTMTRAMETSSIIRKHLPDVPVESSEMLEEGAPCPVDPPLETWKPQDQDFFEDGARIEAAFRKYVHRADPSQTTNSNELFICHANIIRYFVCRALQMPPEAWIRFSLHHCSITWIRIRPSGRVCVYTIGDSGHIPPNKLTTS